MKYLPKTQKILHLADAAICGALWEVNVSAPSRKDILRQNGGIPQQSNATLMPPKWPHMKTPQICTSQSFLSVHHRLNNMNKLTIVVFDKTITFSGLKFSHAKMHKFATKKQLICDQLCGFCRVIS